MKFSSPNVEHFVDFQSADAKCDTQHNMLEFENNRHCEVSCTLYKNDQKNDKEMSARDEVDGQNTIRALHYGDVHGRTFLRI